MADLLPERNGAFFGVHGAVRSKVIDNASIVRDAMFGQCEHRDSRHPVDLSIRSWSKAVKSSSQELPMRKFDPGFSVGVLTFPAAKPNHANKTNRVAKVRCGSRDISSSSDRRKFIGWHEDI